MPDLPVAEGGRPGGGGGINWVAVGAVTGVGVLVLMFVSSKQSSGTTAAGTSINAALGSLQEQQLNTMGLVGKSRQDILDAMAGYDSETQTHLDSVNDNVIAWGQSNLDQSTYVGNLLNYISARQGTQLGWLAGGADPRFAAAMAAQVPGWGDGTPAGYWDAINKQLGIVNTLQDWQWWHPGETPAETDTTVWGYGTHAGQTGP